MIRVALGGLALAATMSSAVAADLIVDEPIYEAAIAAAYDWNGGYVGGFVGYGWGESFFDFSPEDDIDAPVEITGWLVGVTAGANFQSGAFVLGVEGDIAWSDIAGAAGCPDGGFECTTDIHWLGTLRGRAGFAADALLVYATAGLAVADVESDSDPYTPGLTYSSTYVGWTAGGGVEVGLDENVSLKAEYLYTDLGTQTDTDLILDGTDTTVGVTLHTVKAGINFQF